MRTERLISVDLNEQIRFIQFAVNLGNCFEPLESGKISAWAPLLSKILFSSLHRWLEVTHWSLNFCFPDVELFARAASRCSSSTRPTRCWTRASRSRSTTFTGSLAILGLLWLWRWSSGYRFWLRSRRFSSNSHNIFAEISISCLFVGLACH